MQHQAAYTKISLQSSRPYAEIFPGAGATKPEMAEKSVITRIFSEHQQVFKSLVITSINISSPSLQLFALFILDSICFFSVV
jgi:hypothetical protein